MGFLISLKFDPLSHSTASAAELMLTRVSNPSSMIHQNSGVLKLLLMMLCGTQHYMKGNHHRQRHTTWVVWYLYIALYINRIFHRDFYIILLYFFFPTVFQRLDANCVYKLILQSVL